MGETDEHLAACKRHKTHTVCMILWTFSDWQLVVIGTMLIGWDKALCKVYHTYFTPATLPRDTVVGNSTVVECKHNLEFMLNACIEKTLH